MDSQIDLSLLLADYLEAQYTDPIVVGSIKRNFPSPPPRADLDGGVTSCTGYIYNNAWVQVGGFYVGEIYDNTFHPGISGSTNSVFNAADPEFFPKVKSYIDSRLQEKLQDRMLWTDK